LPSTPAPGAAKNPTPAPSTPAWTAPLAALVRALFAASAAEGVLGPSAIVPVAGNIATGGQAGGAVSSFVGSAAGELITGLFDTAGGFLEGFAKQLMKDAGAASGAYLVGLLVAGVVVFVLFHPEDDL
jgi:hypothetical protein